MLIGYARVSTQDQTLDLQLDALKNAGCGKIYTDTASGAKAERKGLEEALDYVREGDILVVWRLDRLGRSLRHLIETITFLNNRKVGFRSLTENIDTTTSGGKLVFHIFGALAEFERDIIRERTTAGLEAARARGRFGGRRSVMTPAKLRLAQAAMGRPDTTVSQLCEELGISRMTLYRHIAPDGELREAGRKLLERQRQNLWRRATNGLIPGRCGTDRGSSLMGNARMPVPATALDHESTIVAVVELSARSWLVGAQVAGVPRQCRQKLAPSAAALLEHLDHLRRRAEGAGKRVGRVVLAYEAGRD